MSIHTDSNPRVLLDSKAVARTLQTESFVPIFIQDCMKVENK